MRERSPLPIIADESCLVATDVPRLAGAVDGINIKLAKCGGLREAMRMIATARAHGMLVMAGCMMETSLGITAAAHFAPLLDYADLDGAALLAHDPYVGASHVVDFAAQLVGQQGPTPSSTIAVFGVEISQARLSRGTSLNGTIAPAPRQWRL